MQQPPGILIVRDSGVIRVDGAVAVSRSQADALSALLGSLDAPAPHGETRAERRDDAEGYGRD